MNYRSISHLRDSAQPRAARRGTFGRYHGRIMMDGMHSMMAWMMGAGLLGAVLLVGLLATIAVLLVQLRGKKDGVKW